MIEDEGPGIPDAELRRVFEPFYRLEQSRSRETGGTGLGLAIAQSIAEAHGGLVTLANRPEGGTPCDPLGAAVSALPVGRNSRSNSGNYSSSLERPMR